MKSAKKNFSQNDLQVQENILDTFNGVIRPIFHTKNEKKDTSWTIEKAKKKIFSDFFEKRQKMSFFNFFFH